MQPYRTLPLLQPSAKVRADLGVGSISHLKMQDDHISGLKEPQYVPQSQAMTAKAKHDELIMKQKVRRPCETVQGSVVIVAGGEEDTATLQGAGAGAGAETGGGRGSRRGSLTGGGGTSSLKDNSDQQKPKKKDKIKSDFMKINKSTFRVGGQVVQLKAPLFDPDTHTDTDTQYPQLRKHSAGNLLTTPAGDHDTEGENLSIAKKRSGGRSRSLCYTVTTTRVEELDDDDQVTIRPGSQTSRVESEQVEEEEVQEQQQQVECTIKLNVPEVREEVEVVEVEETVRLTLPRPPPPPPATVETVSVSQTVRVRRDDYNYPYW